MEAVALLLVTCYFLWSLSSASLFKEVVADVRQVKPFFGGRPLLQHDKYSLNALKFSLNFIETLSILDILARQVGAGLSFSAPLVQAITFIATPAALLQHGRVYGVRAATREASVVRGARWWGMACVTDVNR